MTTRLLQPRGRGISLALIPSRESASVLPATTTSAGEEGFTLLEIIYRVRHHQCRPRGGELGLNHGATPRRMRSLCRQPPCTTTFTGPAAHGSGQGAAGLIATETAASVCQRGAASPPATYTITGPLRFRRTVTISTPRRHGQRGSRPVFRGSGSTSTCSIGRSPRAASSPPRARAASPRQFLANRLAPGAWRGRGEGGFTLAELLISVATHGGRHGGDLRRPSARAGSLFSRVQHEWRRSRTLAWPST